MYPRDVFVRYGGLHRTEAAEVVLYLNIAVCLISAMESGVGRVLRQQSKTFPNTNQHYRLQTEATTNTRTTLYNTTHHDPSLDIFPSNQGAGYGYARRGVR